ncbi:MAG: CoA transferase [Acidimicrobiales bacterium]
MTDTREPGTPGEGVRGPLRGLRVLDLTSVVMGPLCTQILGDQGADVIVVERPAGETNRVMGLGPHPQFSGVALNLMRNKRSVSFDLKSGEGQAAIRRLIPTCDALVTNMLPGALARLGLSYADVAALRPDIVYAQAQGFPLDHARADDPAYDDIMQSATGVADAVARVTGEPGLVPMIVADKVCALVLAQAVTAALLHRARTGEGQHVEVPMVDAMRAFTLVEHGAGAIAEPRRARAGYSRVLSPERRPQRTTDGWINILPYSRTHYDRLFAEGGREDLVGDPSYADGRARIANSDTLYQAVRGIVARRSTAEWLDFCSQAHIPASRVVTLEELVDELPVEDHPVAGPYRHITPGARLSRTPQTLRRHAPSVGEHTAEVLAELEGRAAGGGSPLGRTAVTDTGARGVEPQR